jgi:hypothetical protein
VAAAAIRAAVDSRAELSFSLFTFFPSCLSKRF